MVSKRIKYARAHLSRRRHIAILATPSWRRTQRIDFNSVPRPFTVPRAALKARASKRIKMMSQPKTIVRRKLSLQFPQSHRDLDSPEFSKRLFDLALPKKRLLIYSRRLVGALGNSVMLANINSLLRGLRKSRYQKYRIICNSLQQRNLAREEKIRRKLHRVLKKPAELALHEKALAKLATPKRVHRPPRIPRGPKTGKKPPYDLARLESLAKPLHPEPEDMPDPFRVKRSALSKVDDEHVVHCHMLALPRQRQDPPYREPGFVEPTALTARATKWIVELAKPASRPRGLETDVKEDAFKVPPLALKAWCSPRTKVLAQPKKVKRVKF